MLPLVPGQIIPAPDPVESNAGLPVTTIAIRNTGDVPVHLTAHFHVFEANPRLAFNRRRAYGIRLDVPANGSVRIKPGATVEVRLVPIGGNRAVRGFNGAVDGDLDEQDTEAVLAALIARGFLHEELEPT